MNKDQIQSEALDAIGLNMKAGVNISMGVGKSVLGLKHANKFYHDTARYLVVAPLLTIIDSWKNDAENRGFSYLLPHLVFSSYKLLTEKDFQYDVVYLDECHSLTDSHKEWLMRYEARGGRIVGLTGTYPKNAYSDKGKLCQQFCPLVYSYDTDSAVEDDILNNYKIFVHELRLDKTLSMKKEKKDGNFWMTSEYKEYLYWNNRVETANTPKNQMMSRLMRMKALQMMPGKEVYVKKLFDKQTDKTLLFANTKDQASRLCKDAYHTGIPKELAKLNLANFKAGIIDKLAAVDQLSQGANIPNLRIGIVMHSFSNNRQASQKIGRFLRLNPNETAIIHILCYIDSIDKEWVTEALSSFNQNKIEWIQPI